MKTYFTYPEDKGSFSYAMERCVGVGKCRRMDGGTMCPSYMATREEMHSTRGRARLLFELLEGKVIGQNGWRDDHVRAALDLCLACKGCKSDCPMNVDMATYKAEFLSHYYAGRLRPAVAYSMGLIHWWAKLASLAPSTANFFARTPPFAAIMKRLGGIDQARRIPAFAPHTFKHWFFRRPRYNQGKPRVILWPDTFSNYLRTDAAKAAVDLLEMAGFEVIVPREPLCCGRPLYDFGFLNQAKSALRQVLSVLRNEIRIGTPLVGLEPSCVAVFRDELMNLFPQDTDAIRLYHQTYLLSEFLQKHSAGIQLPKIYRKAIVHLHCHHAAIMKGTDEEAVLKRLGLDYEVLNSGCCGMAGSFGFETKKYGVSVKCGERVLLPAVRAAAKDTLIIADGFSCQEQIKQLTDRWALHLAEVIQMAMRNGSRGPAGNYPEREYASHEISTPPVGVAITTAIAALALGSVVKRLIQNREREPRRIFKH